jgi:hypothetical protein
MNSILFRPICLLSCLVLSACGESDIREEAQTVAVQSQPTYPPGSADALSIGGAISEGDESDFSVAVNCSAALRLTAQTLRTMASSNSSEQIQLIERAADIYERRAEAAGDTDAASGSIGSMIEQQMTEKASESGSQAQLAIACLREFENAS